MGCTSRVLPFVQFFSEDELQGIETAANEMHAKAEAGRLPPVAFHNTHTHGGGLKRTKMFFGARCEPLDNHPLVLS